MINKLKLLILFVFCWLSVDSEAQSEYTRRKAYDLARTWEALKSDSSASAQNAFFEAFPETWTDFVRVSDYLNQGGSGGWDCMDCINAFGHLPAVNDTAYCIKLLMLSSGADYDADAPNYFQGVLHSQMESIMYWENELVSDMSAGKRLRIVFYLLSKALPSDQMRFWQFYWSSLHSKEDGFVSHEQELMRMRGRLEKEGYNPLGYRYMCLESHYRKPLLFTYEALGQAENAYKKLKNRVSLLKDEGELVSLIILLSKS